MVVCFLLKSFDICKLSFVADGRGQHWICIALDFYCFSMLDWIQSPDPSSSCFYSGLHLFSYKGAKEGFKSKNEQMWIKVFFFRFFTRESHILTLRVYRALRRSRESRRGSWWWGRIGGQRKVCRHLWGLWWWHSWWWVDLLWKPLVFCRIEIFGAKIFFGKFPCNSYLSIQNLTFCWGGRRQQKETFGVLGEVLLLIFN